MRFRRISFPVSALLSIIAISLYFFHGLNFGIDFMGGTLIEVQSKVGDGRSCEDAQHARRAWVWARFSCSSSAAPNDVLIRDRAAAGRRDGAAGGRGKVRGALGDEVDYRRVEVVGPRVSGRAAVLRYRSA